MIQLLPIDSEERLGHCESLRRKSTRFVGGAMWLVGLAYIHRDGVNAYGVYDGETLVGLMLLFERTKYGIAEFFIGDKYQRRGYGYAAMQAVIARFRAEAKFPVISVIVHGANKPALALYEKCGFAVTAAADWDSNFKIMEYRLDQTYQKEA